MTDNLNKDISTFCRFYYHIKEVNFKKCNFARFRFMPDQLNEAGNKNLSNV
jgi:hypothetical protein